MRFIMLSILILFSACEKAGIGPDPQGAENSVLTSINIEEMKEDSSLFNHMTAKLYCDSSGNASVTPVLTSEHLEMTFKLQNPQDGDSCFVQIWTDHTQHDETLLKKYQFNERKDNFSSLFFSARSKIANKQLDLTFYSAYGTESTPPDNTDPLPRPEKEDDIVIKGKIGDCEGEIRSDGSGCVTDGQESELGKEHREKIDDLVNLLTKEGLNTKKIALGLFYAKTESERSKIGYLNIQGNKVLLSGDMKYNGTAIIQKVQHTFYGYNVFTTLGNEKITIGFPIREEGSSDRFIIIDLESSLFPGKNDLFKCQY